MKTILSILCLCLVAALHNYSGGAEAFSPEDFKITEAKIPMGDGGALAGDVYLPGTGRFPTILTITSSAKSKCRTEHFPRSDFFNSGDYAVVCVERRGSEGSGDNPLRQESNPDGHDGYDVVEWIARQPWSDGKIGMWGASNQGLIQYATAMTNPPHLVCIMPAETTPITRERGSIGMGYEQLFPGGVLRLEMVQRAERMGAMRRGGRSGRGDSPMVRRLKEHALDDGFLDYRPEGAPALKDVRVPVMAVGAWFDNDKNRTTIRLFKRILAETDSEFRTSHKLLVGPWVHDGVYGDGFQGELEFNNVSEKYRKCEKRFFDFWLRGVDRGETGAPTITYYQMGKNEWRTTENWPPAGVADTSFYLHTGGKLSRAKPPENSPEDEFVSDPGNPTPTVGGQNKSKGLGKGPSDQRLEVETHPDVLVFTTPELRKDLNVAGDIKVILFVSSDAEDTDVAFRLTDFFTEEGENPGPRSMLLRDGILRMSLRKTRREYSFLKAGEVYEAEIATLPIAYTFLKGHRLRLILSASNYPRYEVNTNTREKGDESKVAKNTLYHDASRPSRLILSVLNN